VLGAWEGVLVPASASNAVGGWAPMAAMIAQTGLACRSGNEALVEKGKLGFMAASGIISGSKGKIPVA